MRIIRLHAENIKRLRAVEITPTGNVVVISGKNGQGKTSVLDAIWFALGGRDAMKGTTRPIHNGATKAEVTLDLDDLTVTRSWTADDKSYLRVSAKDGRRYNSPQQVLDELVGRLSFNPLEFMSMHEKEQVTTLLDLLHLPIDLAALDVERTKLYDQRTEVGRVVKRLEGQLSGIPLPSPDLPAEEISAAALLAEMQAATKVKAANEQTMRDLTAASAAVDRCDEVIEDLQRRLREEQEARTKAQAEVDRLIEAVGNLQDPETTDLEQRIATVEEANAAVRAARQRREVEAELAATAKQYNGLTTKIDAIDESKAKAIREAKMPIDGLGFGAEGVTYQGLPLKQASSAEQLRVSMAMAMALNPKLRVIRITDGSRLDSDNLALIAAMAEAEDFQVWLERVEDASGVGVHIEDGVVTQ